MNGPKSLLQMMDATADKIRQSKGFPDQTGNKTRFSDADNDAMTVVFNQLMQIFPGHKKQFPDDDEFDRFKGQFIKGLLDSGVRKREQFEKAFKKARERIYPTFPTIGEFLSWCKREPEDYGYPTAKQALWEVVRHYRDISPAAMLAGRKTKYERGTMSEKDYADVFGQAYRDIVFDAVDNGRDLSAEIAMAIEEKPAEKPRSVAVADSAMSDIRAMFGKKSCLVVKSELTEEQAGIERRKRIIEKRKKLGFSLSKEDKEFLDSL